jgi:hypothetical protein
MAKGKATAQAQKSADGTNKMEAMRQALQELGYDAKPAQLKEHI